LTESLDWYNKTRIAKGHAQRTLLVSFLNRSTVQIAFSIYRRHIFRLHG